VHDSISGTIGKIANYQVAASLTIATRTEHVPVGLALYLPESWTEVHRGGPEAPHPRRGLKFKTKPRVGGRDDQRAIADGGCRLGWCMADARMATTPSFAGACAGVWATPFGYTVRPRCGALDLLGRPNRDPVGGR